MPKYDVTGPDGKTYRVNAPEGASQADAIAFVASSYYSATPTQPAAPTFRQTALASPVGAVARGMKDPLDGAAQLLERMTPAPIANAINSAANFVGGDGTFLGDVLGIKGATSQQMTADMRAADQEYAQARAATGRTGLDVGRIAGNIVSPVNLAAGRLIPAPVGATGARALAVAGAKAGAVGGATQPVLQDDNFASRKTLQVATGAAAGAALTPAVGAVAQAVSRGVQRVMPSQVGAMSPEAVRIRITQAARADGIDPATIPEELFQRLTKQAQDAARSGQTLDLAAAARKADFDALGLPAMRGQVSRDPQQWQREFNLAGVEDVGGPIRDVLRAQSTGINQRMGRQTADAADPFNAGEQLISGLRGVDARMQQDTRAAYDAFKNATGKDLPVPLQGLAQDYARVLDDFQDVIPSAVRSRFEKLGLMDGTLRKFVTIDEAEKLIKTINRNTNPMDAPANRALGELRAAVQKAIEDGAADDAAGAAAQLGKTARQTAATRFRALESSPALEAAAIRDAAPDDFVQKYVLRADVREINKLAEMLPEGRQIMQAQTWRYLQDKAFGANAAGDGKAAQATFNRTLKDIGPNKLEALLGKEGAQEAQRIGRVLAYMKQVPEGATPNTSGTGQMIASLVGQTRGIRNLPYVNDFLIEPMGRFAQRREVANALQAATTRPADLDPATLNRISALLPLVGVSGGALGSGSVR